jgi:hypothetical protein
MIRSLFLEPCFYGEITDEIHPAYSIFVEGLNKTEHSAFGRAYHTGHYNPGFGGAMFKIITMQSVAAVAIAAVLAGTGVFLTSVAPPANAMPQFGLGNETLAKAVQLAPPVSVAACSARSWPNYDQGCLRRSVGELRQVRVINLETRGFQARAN